MNRGGIFILCISPLNGCELEQNNNVSNKLANIWFYPAWRGDDRLGGTKVVENCEYAVLKTGAPWYKGAARPIKFYDA